MNRINYLLILVFLVSCSGDMPVSDPREVVKTDIPVISTIAEPTSTQIQDIPTATPVVESIDPTQTPTAAPVFDLSAVSLVETTHLMDPKYFQVSLENWPDDLPESIQVLVGGEMFTCDELFPDQFPNRVYCWGPAPDRGSEVQVQVVLDGSGLQVLEIPFVVPSPGGGGEN